MNLGRIKELTSMIESASNLKFLTDENNGIKFEGNYHKCINRFSARELAKDLSDAIDPIVKRYEAELRKELALCSKEK